MLGWLIAEDVMTNGPRPALHNCFPWVDVVVRGEGERVLVEIAKDIMAGRSPA